MVDLHEVDWSALPAPEDDGAAAHLVGTALPDISLPSTEQRRVNLAQMQERVVVYAYPMTGRPDKELPVGWDQIPGARGCTPQSCAFRDHDAELKALGVGHVFGLSTQSTEYQIEAVNRLHLPFSLLSDTELLFSNSLNLPTQVVEEMTLLKRLTFIAENGIIKRCWYPVFPPNKNVLDVIAWCSENPVRS